ncbi:hypothetical protein BDQ17DRAFT_584606 [Cyathus striatus]|nr:hypothetical protein BDQ17DRAFT_584606 [Cyathus striatus]
MPVGAPLGRSSGPMSGVGGPSSAPTTFQAASPLPHTADALPLETSVVAAHHPTQVLQVQTAVQHHLTHRTLRSRPLCRFPPRVRQPKARGSINHLTLPLRPLLLRSNLALQPLLSNSTSRFLPPRKLSIQGARMGIIPVNSQHTIRQLNNTIRCTVVT